MNPFLFVVEVGAGLFCCGLMGLLFDALRCAYIGSTRSAPRDSE